MGAVEAAVNASAVEAAAASAARWANGLEVSARRNITRETERNPVFVDGSVLVMTYFSKKQYQRKMTNKETQQLRDELTTVKGELAEVKRKNREFETLLQSVVERLDQCERN